MRRCVSLVLMLVLTTLTSVTAFAEDLEVKIVSLPDQVAGGATQTMVVKTEAGATCRAHAFSKNSNFVLRATKAANDGMVTWSWQTGIGRRVVQVQVMCEAGDRKGTAVGSFNVIGSGR